jgi:hypothetical protein
VAVSVKLSAGHAIRTETVWFAVKAARTVAVYGADTAQGTPAGAIRIRQAEVDTARMHGHPV